jgi:hypothetical protein
MTGPWGKALFDNADRGLKAMTDDERDMISEMLQATGQALLTMAESVRAKEDDKVGELLEAALPVMEMMVAARVIAHAQVHGADVLDETFKVSDN